MEILMSTTTKTGLPSTIHLEDAGLRPIDTPITDYDLYAEHGLTIEDLTDLTDMSDYVRDGYLTLLVNGQYIDETNIDDVNSNPIIINNTTGGATERWRLWFGA